MRFTDLFIKRPVLSVSVSLLILLMGLYSIQGLQIREYPNMTMPIVHVKTNYYGADSKLIQGFITEPLEQALAQANNVDYIESKSYASHSDIKVHMKLNTEPNDALAEVLAQVNSVKSKLPKEAEDPNIILIKNQQLALLYLKFESDELNASQLTDYIERVIKPYLFTADGVSKVNLYGGVPYAMRVWLDPQRMGAFQLSASAVRRVLNDNNFQSAVGRANSFYTLMNGSAQTQINTVEGLKQLVVGDYQGAVIRLEHIADVSLEKSHDVVRALANGKEAVIAAVDMVATANTLDVAAAVRKLLPEMQRNLPSAIQMDMLYDASVAVDESIDEVIHTIIEATLIVIVVITLFLGSYRAVVIPVITIPLSLVGVCFMMQLFGFSLNLMTLLAMVLAIGLVVDDAIVVVENIERHLKQGESPFRAAIIGTREIALPVISMTITLAAVYAPIAFMTGMTGSLFKEFALTLSGAVFISGVIALTLSPMMCSKILKHTEQPSFFQQKVESKLESWTQSYAVTLEKLMLNKKVILIFSGLVFFFLPIFFYFIPSELAPKEDKGFVMMFAEAPSNVNLDYIQANMEQAVEILNDEPAAEASLSMIGVPNANQSLSIVPLVPWSERHQNQTEVKYDLNQKMAQIVGMKISVIEPAPLPGTSGLLPLKVVVTSSDAFENLFEVTLDMMQKMQASSEIIYSKMDLNYDAVNMSLHIKRDMAGAYGVSMKEIGSTLSTFMSDGLVNRTSLAGRSYEVIPQAVREDRDLPEKLSRYYVKAADGRFIPLSSLIDVEIKSEPRALPHFNQMHAATISAMLTPGISMGAGVALVKRLGQMLPKGYSYDFLAESRQYEAEGNALYITLGLALAIVFLVLASQFESIRDPWVILISVPLAISGALVALNWGHVVNVFMQAGMMSGWSQTVMSLLKLIQPVSMNIYSQVGLITLVGLITKHGILMCEVAKEMQIHQQSSREEAIKYAAKIRLRPILMTTAAMVAGLIPLLFAEGAGAVARFNMGFVIVAGLSIGTWFTLFVLPVIYTYVAEQHRPLEQFEES
tara:strand:- start:9902 stop:13033 length:3132 start_codon:yes stop_codon:yes gene_type:complete